MKALSYILLSLNRYKSYVTSLQSGNYWKITVMLIIEAQV